MSSFSINRARRSSPERYDAPTLKAEALPTRFETPPRRASDRDPGGKVKAFAFVTTLGHWWRLHVLAFQAEKQEHWFAGLDMPGDTAAPRVAASPADCRASSVNRSWRTTSELPRC